MSQEQETLGERSVKMIDGELCVVFKRLRGMPVSGVRKGRSFSEVMREDIVFKESRLTGRNGNKIITTFMHPDDATKVEQAKSDARAGRLRIS